MNMKKLLVLSLVMVLAIIGGNRLNAQTAANTLITNQVQMSADNVGTPVSALVATNIGVIAGGTFSVSPALTTSAGADDVVNLIWTIRNDGNTSDNFNISYNSQNSNGGTAWTVNLLNATSGNLAMGATANVTLQITLASAPPDNTWYEFRLMADSTIASPIIQSRYLSDNSVDYFGGMMGVQWDGVTVVDDGTVRSPYNNWCRITASGPVLRISKAITGIELNSVAQTYAVPGATITYVITVSNTGSAGALNAVVSDTIPSETAYDSASVIAGQNDWVITTPDADHVQFDVAEFSNSAGPGYSQLQITVIVE